MSINRQNLRHVPKLNTTRNYSPNFDLKKRNPSEIKFLIFHYTGMKTEKVSIDRLTNIKSKVSCHYLIKNNGTILTIVPDLYVAWHAGVSKWKKYNHLNKNSIGIEICNPGHNFNYKKFSKKQINSTLSLSKFLINQYKIKSKNILGHSDIAPYRKKDPGEKFPWKYLSKKKIGFWHSLTQNYLIKKRNLKINDLEKKIFFKNLFKIGYPKENNLDKVENFKKLTKAFQRRFRQELVNGVVDQECLIITKNLLKF